MAKPEWGVKRTCLSCAARFYDLGRDPIICPNCGAELDLSAAGKPRRARAEAAAAPAESGDTAVLVDENDTEVAAGEDDALAHSEEGEEEPSAPARKSSPDTADEGDEELGEFAADPLIEGEEEEDDTGIDPVRGRDPGEDPG